MRAAQRSHHLCIHIYTKWINGLVIHANKWREDFVPISVKNRESLNGQYTRLEKKNRIKTTINQTKSRLKESESECLKKSKLKHTHNGTYVDVEFECFHFFFPFFRFIWCVDFVLLFRLFSISVVFFFSCSWVFVVDHRQHHTMQNTYRYTIHIYSPQWSLWSLKEPTENELTFTLWKSLRKRRKREAASECKHNEIHTNTSKVKNEHRNKRLW